MHLLVLFTYFGTWLSLEELLNIGRHFGMFDNLYLLNAPVTSPVTYKSVFAVELSTLAPVIPQECVFWPGVRNGMTLAFSAGPFPRSNPTMNSVTLKRICVLSGARWMNHCKFIMLVLIGISEV